MCRLVCVFVRLFSNDAQTMLQTFGQMNVFRLTNIHRRWPVHVAMFASSCHFSPK